jgi:hypothetical protein
VRDLGDLANNWLPFIMYNKVSKNRYETFLCILNIEKMGEEKKWNSADDKYHKILENE